MEEQKCNLCKKECPVSDLKCKKGRELYMRNDSYYSDNNQDAEFMSDNCHCSEGKGQCHGKHGERMGQRGQGCQRGRGRGSQCHLNDKDCSCKREEETERDLTFLLNSCCRGMNHRMPQQGRIRRMIGRCGDMSQKELQERLGVQAGSISEIINKMEKKGILERREDPCDRRRRRLYLGANAQCCNEDETDDFFDVLTKEEQETLKNLLLKLLNAVRHHSCS